MGIASIKRLQGLCQGAPVEYFKKNGFGNEMVKKAAASKIFTWHLTRIPTLIILI